MSTTTFVIVAVMFTFWILCWRDYKKNNPPDDQE